MTPKLYPPKPKPGDRVAVLSPSAGVPALFPHVFEQGLRRLRTELELEPVEYPTTRVLGADPRHRARDIEAAFADPEITAVLASIGGDDQITVTPHLDADLLRGHPKPFFGYSDNTNLLLFLFDAGLVGYHGGSVMVHLGRSAAPHPTSIGSLRAALFTDGWYELPTAPEYGDEPPAWQDPANLGVEPPMMPAPPWTWAGAGADAVIEAPLWGGNVEIISWLLQAGRIRSNETYAGHVLVLETSEEMPAAEEVFRVLRNMGERGLLQQFRAVLVGRAKAWDRGRPHTPEQKRAYVDDQQQAVRRAFAAYHPDAVIVFDLDIGHTDPQLILPIGGSVRIDPRQRRISVRY